MNADKNAHGPTRDGPPRSEARRAAAESFYGALAAHPDAARRVGWESPAAHRMRQLAIVEALAPLSSIGSLIDAGCGEAALLPVLRGAGFDGGYLGEDVLEGAIARARGTLDDARARLEVADSFGGSGERAAAVVCSGALNTLSGAPDHDLEAAAALSALWERSEELLVVDVAVADRHAPGVGLARCDLARLWAHARGLTPIVTVREDVVPGEALLCLSRSRARAFSRRTAEPLVRA
jgi:hypothetical protein